MKSETQILGRIKSLQNLKEEARINNDNRALIIFHARVEALEWVLKNG